MSIRTRFVIVIGVLSLVACLVLAYTSYTFSVKNAMENAKTQGAMVFNMIDSSRLYFKNHQRPIVLELVEEDRFFPQIMSGFVVTRGVWEQFNKAFPDYVYKQATVDPLYPPNKADPDEVKFIEAFDKDRELKNFEGRITKEGQEYYYFARPISVGKGCLRCHGDPDDAPKDQIEIYGSENGYDWRHGEVVSTSIVYVPLGKAMAAAKKAASTIFFIGTAGIILLMAVIWFFLSSGVVTPLHKLQEKTMQISLGKELDQDVGISSKDEIGDLARAIDRLRISTAKMLKRCGGGK